MKKYLLLLSVLAILISCKKNGKSTANENKEIARFSIGARCGVLLPDSLAFADSVLVFYNQSFLNDSTDPAYKPSVTFKWNFGDQTGSTDNNPTHKYSLPGTYTTTLYTYLDGRLSDSSTRSRKIVLGLREFKIDAYNLGIDIDQANDNGAIVLFQGEILLNGQFSYGILLVDSLLNQKWVKQIPGTNNTVRLNSIKRIDNSSYILSGNYTSGNINQFCLSKIDNSGSLIWNKYITNLSGTNTFTTPVSDGGLITAGDCTNGALSYGAIVKCDASGNEIWRRTFDTGTVLHGINNILETANGYIFAALSPDPFPKILLTQLDVSGNTIKQSPTTPPYPLSGGQAGVVYGTNAWFVYATDPGADNYVYFFNNDLSFSGSIPFQAGSMRGGFFEGNNFGFFTSGVQYSEIGQIAGDGTILWQYTIDPNIYLSCTSLLNGASRFCRKAVFSANTNEIWALSDGENKDNGESLYLVKLTADGKIK
jgi:PKD repeat protein